jgi:predicted protein tyrosine phosphatase
MKKAAECRVLGVFACISVNHLYLSPAIHEPVSQKEVNDVAVVMLMEAHKRKCLKELEVAVKKATMVPRGYMYW